MYLHLTSCDNINGHSALALLGDLIMKRGAASFHKRHIFYSFQNKCYQFVDRFITWPYKHEKTVYIVLQFGFFVCFILFWFVKCLQVSNNNLISNKQLFSIITLYHTIKIWTNMRIILNLFIIDLKIVYGCECIWVWIITAFVLELLQKTITSV